VPNPRDQALQPPRRHRGTGQSLVEFALIVPVMLLILLAIADMGRLYTSAVAVESAAREAADFGSFDTSYWDDTLGNVGTTIHDMKLRACTAAKGSHLESYAQSDPADDTTCTNPTFTCTLEHGGSTTPCEGSAGSVGGVDCWDKAVDPPCTVHVRLNYDFRTFLAFPPMPQSIAVIRDSRFRLSTLEEPGTP
jgi:TadE-like protein